jgi:thymidylate kinase
MLIAFEGLDQSGKETQARHLRARIEQEGRAGGPRDCPRAGR